jgi:hypothetical protein
MRAMGKEARPPEGGGTLAEAKGLVRQTAALEVSRGLVRRSRESHARALASLAADTDRLERSRELLRRADAPLWSVGEDVPAGGSMAS